MNDVVSIRKLERWNYEGLDVSLETSLFEYGIAWKIFGKRPSKYVKFIVGVELDEKGCFCRFITGDYYLTETGEISICDKKIADMLSSIDCASVEEWKKYSLSCKISDINSYYGSSFFVEYASQESCEIRIP